MISVSIISHGHGAMLTQLVRQLLMCTEVNQILLTKNIPEFIDLPEDPRITLIDNPSPKGFGANHNAAFSHCKQPYFCILNPDVELIGKPFLGLLNILNIEKSDIVAPVTLSKKMRLEDNIRRFPTLISLLLKALNIKNDLYATTPEQAPFCPDWVAGMFMLFCTESFTLLGGFDENFFLYYEDVDICARTWKAGMKITACPSISVVHDARRASRRDWRFMRWHLFSMVRYFWKHWGRLPKIK